MSEYFMSTNKVGLREVDFGDINATYCSWLNDSDVNKYMQARYSVWNIDKMKKYIESMLENEYLFAICCLKTSKHVGNVKLGPVDWINRKAEISILVGDKKFWGKGYGTDAVKLISEYALKVLSLNKVTAGCYINNQGSANIFLKNGFSQEGLLKREVVFEGKYTDVMIFGKLSGSEN